MPVASTNMQKLRSLLRLLKQQSRSDILSCYDRPDLQNIVCKCIMMCKQGRKNRTLGPRYVRRVLHAMRLQLRTIKRISSGTHITIDYDRSQTLCSSPYWSEGGDHTAGNVCPAVCTRIQEKCGVVKVVENEGFSLVATSTDGTLVVPTGTVYPYVMGLCTENVVTDNAALCDSEAFAVDIGEGVIIQPSKKQLRIGAFARDGRICCDNGEIKMHTTSSHNAVLELVVCVSDLPVIA